VGPTHPAFLPQVIYSSIIFFFIFISITPFISLSIFLFLTYSFLFLLPVLFVLLPTYPLFLIHYSSLLLNVAPCPISHLLAQTPTLSVGRLLFALDLPALMGHLANGIIASALG
jgi:hypothetical protein